jgi:hypothetical protein
LYFQQSQLVLKPDGENPPRNQRASGKQLRANELQLAERSHLKITRFPLWLRLFFISTNTYKTSQLEITKTINNIQTTTMSLEHAKRLYAATLVCFVLGLFTWFSDLPSIALTLHMVVKGHIVRHKVALILLSVVELLMWLVFPCFIWYFSIEDKCVSEASTSIDITNDCGDNFFNSWRAAILVFVSMLGLGITRILLSRTFDGCHPNVQPTPLDRSVSDRKMMISGESHVVSSIEEP